MLLAVAYERATDATSSPNPLQIDNVYTDQPICTFRTNTALQKRPEEQLLTSSRTCARDIQRYRQSDFGRRKQGRASLLYI